MPTLPSRRRWGFFGGSFDPIQKSHLQLAVAAQKQLGLERVYLVPAAQSPHKPHGTVANARDRLTMVRRSVRGLSGLRVGNWELLRPGPSYTYRTLRYLRLKYPKVDWWLLLGGDSWNHLNSWRRWKEIVRHHPVTVARRQGRALRRWGRDPQIQMEVLKVRLPARSSRDLRRKIASGISVRQDIPAAALRYIRSKGLYRS